MRGKLILLGLGVLVGATLYWQLDEAEQALGERAAAPAYADSQQLLASEGFEQGEASIATSFEVDSPVAELPPNDTAPDPQLLAGRQDLQEAFDEAAAPGQFVTPPNVSMPRD